MQNRATSLLKELCLFSLAILMAVTSFFAIPQVSAKRILDKEQQVVYDKGIEYFDVDEECVPSGGSGKTVFLDPGHHEPETNSINDAETYNTLKVGGGAGNAQEAIDNFNVASKVKEKLTQAGYNVIMSKNSVDEKVGLVKRGQMSIDNKADIAVSIHTTEKTGGKDNMVWAQNNGEYRYNYGVVGDEDKKIDYGHGKETFNNDEVTKRSQAYADAVASARKTAEGHDIYIDKDGTLMANSFPEGRLSSAGNIAINMLVGGNGGIPWVYNEIARDTSTGLSDVMLENYATGLANGIKAALGSSSANDSSGDNSATNWSGDCTNVSSYYDKFEKWIDTYYTLGQEYGIPWELIMAQAIAESSFADSGDNCHNHLGIEAKSGDARCNGGRWASFNNYDEALERYANALSIQEVIKTGKFANDPYGFVDYLQNGGTYQYASKAEAGGDEYADKVSGYICGIQKWAKENGHGDKVSSGGGSSNSCGSSLSAAGDVKSLQETIAAFAWENYRGKDCKSKPAYQEQVKDSKYKGASCYTNSSIKGIDCGAFVYQVITKSGWDPEYGNGSGQTLFAENYLKKSDGKWKNVTADIRSNADAQPGDVMVTQERNGHIAIFGGDIPGFESPIMSASQGSRAPMADRANDITKFINGTADGRKYRVYRKVK